MEVIRSCALLNELPEADIEHLAKSVRSQSYRKNTIILGVGDETDSIYLIKSGKVRAYRDSEEGRQITLNTLGPGEIFGELAAIADAPRIASIETLDATEVLVFTSAQFLDLVTRQPKIALDMLKTMARQVRTMSVDISDIALLEVYGRVARVLLKIAKQEGDLWVIDGVTHQDIANRAGSSRETVSRIMKELRNKKLIRVEGRKIIIEHGLFDNY